MRVHYLQHVTFEGLGFLQPWLTQRGHEITSTQLYDGAKLPSLDDLDFLIVMGGPMSVNDEDKFPWLIEEKRFIAAAIDQGKYVLGICLGAQLIATALGSRVYQHTQREIGWFPVDPVQTAAPKNNSHLFAASFEAFHWHGDTFDLPKDTEHLASSAGCHNQAFAFGDRVLALQFHLEATQETAEALIQHCGDELTPGQSYVQTDDEILADPKRFAGVNAAMENLMQNWIADI